jgi:hypothetical protein
LGQKTGCGSEPCERRDARDRRETASAGPIPAQVTDLRLLPPDPGAAVSRGVERFAEQPVSGQFVTIEFPRGIDCQHECAPSALRSGARITLSSVALHASHFYLPTSSLPYPLATYGLVTLTFMVPVFRLLGSTPMVYVPVVGNVCVARSKLPLLDVDDVS